MSERRRRRVDEGDDSEEATAEDSADEQINTAVKDTNSDVKDHPHVSGTGESEYESAEEEDGETLSDGGVPLDENKDGEVENGDEMEPAKEKQLDDDEDRRNPQYIPKKGTFYEHDDRTAATEEIEEPPKKEEKKKVWKEDDKWRHDKFDESEQTPKSRDEIVGVYGYDIRTEDLPPKARRPRHYGRGPNKYTRNWEDEDAYTKPTRGGMGRGGERGRGRDRGYSGGRNSSPRSAKRRGEFQVRTEDFPQIHETRRSSNEERRGGRTTGDRRDHAPSERRGPRRDDRQFGSGSKPSSVSGTAPLPNKRLENEATLNEQPLPPRHAGRGNFSNARVNRGGNNANTQSRRSNQRKGVDRTEQRSHSEGRTGMEGRLSERGSDAPNVKEDSVGETSNIDVRAGPVHTDNKKMTKGNFHGNFERRQVIPPRMQEVSANRPKRYSSQRQRPQDSGGVVFTQSSVFFENSYQQQQQATQQGSQQQPVYSESPPPVPTSSPHIIPQATFTPTAFPAQPVYSEAFVAAPPRPPPPPVATAAPAMMAAPYMATNNSVINYGPPPTQYTPSYPPFQGFAQVTPPPPPPQELYRGGVTYYNTQSQMPRVTPVKRPKAAIPIVAPPDIETGSLSTNESSSLALETEGSDHGEYDDVPEEEDDDDEVGEEEVEEEELGEDDLPKEHVADTEEKYQQSKEEVQVLEGEPVEDVPAEPVDTKTTPEVAGAEPPLPVENSTPVVDDASNTHVEQRSEVVVE